ncbi:MAG TPA: threonine--tRNA ligase [Hypericibacter adhaerens]|uniref:Threonine--tRNA ligase n=1 Tax=Hypericibacter adhaerens TaxID=2602016 RepID=A0A5J6MSS3_9PROT|nr:threonine--tRNA ligase [Hypericibacter adhaerens]QEX20321.1 threonine--tRNA ligase [Hypericibacter adhaerens]HWA41839.1 threonine--tRNA ligase [Hypericibacter adhaerens]
MIHITLPDGSRRSYDQPVSGDEIAASIGKGLARDALAVKIDGELKDLATVIDRDAKIEIVTRKHPDALELLRHDAAHVLAEAVQELYPGTQITFGPAIENGFYYDFVRDEPFTPEDFLKIEQRMREIVDRDEKITREIWSRDEAVRWFKDHGEKYKAEWVLEIPKDEEISIYRQGSWLDMCTGPHLPSTAKLGKAFKLMKVSGAYWRGDANNQQLQRVYGTAWADEKQLQQYLTMLEEAEKRDHRRLGKEMNLFHQQEEAAGMVFWHPKGWTLYRTVENYLRGRLDQSGYVEVKTPQLVDRKLWEASGHWEKFRENMYLAENEAGLKEYVADPSQRIFALKPMNCPCHVQIFNQGLKSYRDLPLRLAEFGSCHRFEPGGALHGIMRVRNFTQDDAHIFCTEDQITAESVDFCRLLLEVYGDFGFTDVAVRFADRPLKRAGTDAIWDKAEAALKYAVERAQLPYTMAPGEGAFYGPKLEFHLKDTIGRSWQCGTLQVDFVLPERLDANYIAEDGQKHRPVMLHRAIFGSMERFLGILIENHAGKLPLWLAPLQVVVATITDDSRSYAEEVAGALRAAGLRVETDARNEKINYKVREHSLAKVPVLAVVGKREAEKREVALRRLGGNEQEVLALDEALNRLKAEARSPAGKSGAALAAGAF